MKPTAYHYELVLSRSGKWFHRRVSRNGETQFVSQMYSTKSNAKRAIRNLDPNATITTVTDP